MRCWGADSDVSGRALELVLRENTLGPQLHSWEGETRVEGAPAGNRSRAWNLGL